MEGQNLDKGEAGRAKARLNCVPNKDDYVALIMKTLINVFLNILQLILAGLRRNMDEKKIFLNMPDIFLFISFSSEV